MPVLSLPEPPGWPAGRRRGYRVLLVAMVVFSPGIVYGVWAFARGHVLTAIAAFGFIALPVIMLGYLLLVLAGRTSLRASSSAAGTTLRPDRLLAGALGLGLACFIPAGVAFLVFVPTGQIIVPLTPGWRIGTLIAMGFAVAIAVRLVIVWWQKRGIGMGSVQLTTTGVEVTTAVSAESTHWSDVIDVSDETEAKKTRTVIVLHRKDGTEQVLDGADFYVPKGIGLYWMVHHYWRHPEDRAELTDGRALERLRAERFDVS